MNAYAQTAAIPVAQAEPSVRAEFIRRTYTHLAGAILAFVLLEGVLLNIPGIGALVQKMVGGGWLVVLGLFIGVSWLAEKWANSDTSIGMQYLGLGAFIVAEAIVFLPILFIAVNFFPPEAGVIGKAAVLTLTLFGGLTATVMVTRKDFSFLRPIIAVGGFIALGMIVVSIFAGFNLGVLFSGAMVALAAGSILYQTSNVLHHYRPDQHVAASLSLFASVALLFWYVLRIVMAFSSRD